jgi:uncharacterized MAPEG superfamily protein
MTLPQWALLAFVLWTLLLLVSTVGVARVGAILRRRARPNDFNAAVPHGSERYQRSMRAHMNCVENLPIFAALVLLGTQLGVASPAFEVAAASVVPARLVQSIVHVASGRNRAVLLRFGAYAIQLLCFCVMAACLILARG